MGRDHECTARLDCLCYDAMSFITYHELSLLEESSHLHMTILHVLIKAFIWQLVGKTQMSLTKATTLCISCLAFGNALWLQYLLTIGMLRLFSMGSSMALFWTS